MVSYEELIYAFTDIYLQTAVECSICMENYEMADDEEFLEVYMQQFISLLRAVENDSEMKLDVVKNYLQQTRKECLEQYHSFLEYKVMQNALEHATREEKSLVGENANFFAEKMQKYYQTVFTDEFQTVKESPMRALEYIRDVEERL